MHPEPSQSNPLIGDRSPANRRDFADAIALDDHKIAFAVKHCRGKEVLDIGCVQHNPENYRSKFWVHNALRSVASHVVGLDYYKEGVDYLNRLGYDIVHADAQQFHLGRRFDAIMAGDIIEHLENLDGFLECCKEHLRDDGVLLITTPNPWYWKNTVKAALLPEVRTNPEHTCWFCPQTLRQLLGRHGLRIAQLTFGARYRSDRWMPLPTQWKCTTFHAAITK
ncbi:MAG: class I SAM-dependent methyltransferase [Burkholderiaceae bacterium]|nr:class I SAM-dependent methyltransferase [Burkholderiaceae bacterium]